MGIRKKCLIITLLCFSSLMHASEFMFKHLEVKDGLSNNQVRYLPGWNAGWQGKA